MPGNLVVAALRDGTLRDDEQRVGGIISAIIARRLGDMNETDLRTWLDRYGRAWETRDPEEAAALFSEDASYYETPFVEPAKGRAGVFDYWANATGGQSDVSFSDEIVAVAGNRGVARWRARFKRNSTGATVVLDGIFLLEFDEDGLCRELREWWHRAGKERQDD